MKGLSCMLVVAVWAGGALCVTVGNITLDEDAWWGPDDTNFTQDTSIRSFTPEFSDEATSLPGLGGAEMGAVMRNLMKRLGHDHYYLQAGDWGAYVASSIATLFPEEVLGYHTNFAVSLHSQSLMAWYLESDYPDLVVDPSVADRMYPISKILKFYALEFGYFHIQAAKPDTIDSPVGLLAYMFQLMSTVTRANYTYSEDGGLENQFTKDQLIDTLMVYWSTNSITTAIRLYAEIVNLKLLASDIGFTSPTPVLTWTIHAKDEVIYQSPYLLKFKFPNLVNSTILNTGGHYLAKELLETFSEDVLTAITAFRRIHDECE